MKILNIATASLVCLMLVTSSSLVFAKITTTKDSDSDNEHTITRYDCVGTFSYLDNGANIMEDKIEHDLLEEFEIYRYEKDPDRLDLKLGIEVVSHNPKDPDVDGRVSETESQIVGSRTDIFESKTLIKFNKTNNKILMVSNSKNGLVNKYEGDCF